MIDSNQLTSLLVKSQLPEFVRDNPDYSNFVLFLEAYYQWLEETGQVTERTKNLLNYKDIDKTTDEFMDYFINEFMPYFPKDSLVSKEEALKIAKQLYQTKGTPASYQFLFRTLYDSDFDVFYTKEAVLKPSDGEWYIPKSLKLATDDNRFLQIGNYRLLGEDTRSIATVEASIKVGTKTEVFISNIQRLFHSGEFVTVVDNFNQPVVINGTTLRAKIVGQLSQVNINPNNRGLLYNPGDPVIIYGGLNAANGRGAIAEVGTTTRGSIQRINVVDGSFGYTLDETYIFEPTDPFTSIDITNAPGAIAIVNAIDPAEEKTANVSFISSDTISRKRNIMLNASNYNFANVANANVNTILADAFSFLEFSTYPISSVAVMNGGGGISKIPVVTPTSKYNTDVPDIDGKLRNVGILSPIQIANAGTGYTVNNTIVIQGGTGYGAKANITSVGANGEIQQVKYVQSPLLYPLGGMGYNSNSGVTITVQSTNPSAANASLYVPGILGEGATFSVVVDRVGAVSEILLTEPGEDYVTNANVSLRIQDIVVSNVNISLLPQKEDVIYQGANVNAATYYASVESVSLIQPNANPAEALYNLRVFNYNTAPDRTAKLKYTAANTLMQLIITNSTPEGYEDVYDNPGDGIKVYGDGTARATSEFLDGLVIGQGSYLNKAGQPSSYNVLQSQNFNNYTYIISVEKEISKYRQVLLDLLHPAGLKFIGKHRTKSNVEFNTTGSQGFFQGHTLQYYTGYNGTSANVVTTFTNKSNNAIKINNLAGADIGDIFGPRIWIDIRPTGGPNIRSQIRDVDSTNNIVYIDDSIWLTYANVAYGYGSVDSDIINITALTNSYNIINNGVYSNTSYPLKDIIRTGDWILVGNNTQRLVESVDYSNNQVTLVSNLSSNSSNGLISVRRTIDTTEVILYGSTGYQYVPQLTTEDNVLITTEDDRIIILG